MTKVCPKCGVMNDKDNKFCFECGTKLPETEEGKGGGESPSVERRRKLKKRWKRGEIGTEEYRSRLLKLRIREKFETGEMDDEG